MIENNILGVVLAGGKSKRFGQEKSQVKLGDKTLLEPNMTFHFMPALWFDDWGIEITESIIITEKGAETLANVPRKLFVKD